MLQSFGRDVEIPEQRRRVALNQPIRNHPKRHATGDHRRANRKKRDAAKLTAATLKAGRHKLKLRRQAYWQGRLDEYPAG